MLVPTRRKTGTYVKNINTIFNLMLKSYQTDDMKII